ncbi:hypothetical protein [Desulfitobacterium hafniense]|nr:hypothetical protein [Desulfitobacterium hafniense]
MKKGMILTASALALSLALVGCSNVEVSVEEKEVSADVTTVEF